MSIKRIIAGILYKDDTFLIAQRSKRDVNYEKWEFPGGKVEAGETDEACLKRELFEEFGIHAVVGKYVATIPFVYNDQDMEMVAYLVPSYEGTLVLHEHKAILWVRLDQMDDFTFPDPDIPLIQELRLFYTNIVKN